MPRSFIIKPTDEVVSEAESWLGFRDNDPVRIEADEIYHLIHEADNVLMLEAQASGERRVADAIEAIKEQAQRVAPLFDFNTGAEHKLFMEEVAVISDMISTLQNKADVAWGLSHQEGLGYAIILRLAVNNLDPIIRK